MPSIMQSEMLQASMFYYLSPSMALYIVMEVEATILEVSIITAGYAVVLSDRPQSLTIS